MERCWKVKPGDRPSFRDIEHDLHLLTHSLEQPAAPNAVYVDTPISFPDCHRFKDDAAVVAKVKAAMKTMSPGPTTNTMTVESSPIVHEGAASLSLSVSSDEGEYIPVRDTPTGGVEVSDEEGSHLPGSSLPYDNAAPAPEPATHGLPAAGKVLDDGYFLLEWDSRAGSAEAVEMEVFQPTGAAGGSGDAESRDRGVSGESVVSWRGQTELRDLTTHDDGYFVLERDDSTRL